MELTINRTDYGKNLLMIIFFSVAIMAVGSLIVLGLFSVFSGESFQTVSGWVSHPVGSRHLMELRIFQISYGICAFIVASYASAYWISGGKPMEYLGLKNSTSAPILMVTTAMMVGLLPLINGLGAWNMQMTFPDSLQWLGDWMKEQQVLNDRLMTQFLKPDGMVDLIMNLLMIAIIPAIGEELLFRGLIQRQFQGLFKNAHIAIWITAIIFSAVHLQFYGFIPRLVLGVLFGYLVVYTGSIWPAIVAHFINNGVAVVFTWWLGVDRVNDEVDRLGASMDQWPLLLISLFIGSICIWFLIKFGRDPQGEIFE